MSKTAGTKIRAIVLLSGGLDSAVALYWAKRKEYRIQTMTFNYFLRSSKEAQAAKKIATMNKLPYKEINLDFLKEIEDSKTRNPLLKKAESAYIPSRNVIFYGIATSFAEIADAKYIIAGHNNDDVENFPDSSIPFFDHFNATTKMGLFTGDRTGRIVLPLGRLSKVEVIKLGAKLGVPFEVTWSCYRSSEQPCRRCHSCRLRVSAFAEAGITDPLLRDK